MIRTLYIGNLPGGVPPERLAELVGRHLPVVEARVVVDPETGRSRGFAFVDVMDCKHLRRAISVLNGCLLEGHELRVAEARSPRPVATRGMTA